MRGRYLECDAIYYMSQAFLGVAHPDIQSSILILKIFFERRRQSRATRLGAQVNSIAQGEWKGISTTNGIRRFCHSKILSLEDFDLEDLSLEDSSSKTCLRTVSQT